MTFTKPVVMHPEIFVCLPDTLVRRRITLSLTRVQAAGQIVKTLQRLPLQFADSLTGFLKFPDLTAAAALDKGLCRTGPVKEPAAHGHVQKVHIPKPVRSVFSDLKRSVVNTAHLDLLQRPGIVNDRQHLHGNVPKSVGDIKIDGLARLYRLVHLFKNLIQLFPVPALPDPDGLRRDLGILFLKNFPKTGLLLPRPDQNAPVPEDLKFPLSVIPVQPVLLLRTFCEKDRDPVSFCGIRHHMLQNRKLRIGGLIRKPLLFYLIHAVRVKIGPQDRDKMSASLFHVLFLSMCSLHFPPGSQAPDTSTFSPGQIPSWHRSHGPSQDASARLSHLPPRLPRWRD